MGKVAPFLAMVLSLLIIAFFGGVFVTQYQIYPYPVIHDGARTLSALVTTFRPPAEWDFGKPVEPSDVSPGDAAASRWTIYDASAPRLPILANGGLNQFLDLCPEHGCIAVLYDENSEIAETWPYRPAEIYAADLTEGSYPHEILTFDPLANVNPVSVQPFANGDVLINFHSSRAPIFPYGMGVSRVDGDGQPRWTRFDFSHHWTTIAADETAYVPGLIVAEESLRVSLGTGTSRRNHTLKCDTGRPYHDTVQLIDADGAVIEEINFTPIMLESNWSAALLESTDFCDPLHLNYVDIVGPDAGPGLEPGDLVLSLRNISRFAIFDPDTATFKHVQAGGFLQQHSVHHLTGTKFLIFDNRGGDAFGPASRIVEFDIATGTERRVFPNADTPEPYRDVFTDVSGYLDISPDRRRVLASFTHSGFAFEVDIASGRLLAAYDNVHDVSSLPNVPDAQREQAMRYSIYGMSYLRP